MRIRHYLFAAAALLAASPGWALDGFKGPLVAVPGDDVDQDEIDGGGDAVGRLLQRFESVLEENETAAAEIEATIAEVIEVANRCLETKAPGCEADLELAKAKHTNRAALAARRISDGLSSLLAPLAAARSELREAVAQLEGHVDTTAGSGAEYAEARSQIESAVYAIVPRLPQDSQALPPELASKRGELRELRRRWLHARNLEEQFLEDEFQLKATLGKLDLIGAEYDEIELRLREASADAASMASYYAVVAESAIRKTGATIALGDHSRVVELSHLVEEKLGRLGVLYDEVHEMHAGTREVWREMWSEGDGEPDPPAGTDDPELTAWLRQLTNPQVAEARE